MNNKIGYLVSISVGGNYGGGLKNVMIPMVEHPIKWYADWKKLYEETKPDDAGDGYSYRIDSEKYFAGRSVQYYDVCILNVIETNATGTYFLSLFEKEETEEDDE